MINAVRSHQSNTCSLTLGLVMGALFVYIIQTAPNAIQTKPDSSQSSSGVICSVFSSSTGSRQQADVDDVSKMKSVFAYQKLGRVQGLANPASTLENVIYSILPRLTCPEMVRLGTIGDGGKFMCRPWRGPANCVAYSFGVGGDPSWEMELLQLMPGCSTYSFDPNNGFAALFDPNNKRMHFNPYKLVAKADHTQNLASFESIRAQYQHTTIDFLKIDIELGEFDIVPEVTKNGTGPITKICHIFVEVHTVAGKQFSDMMKLMEDAGYIMYAREVLFCGAPCSEYSYIHESCLNEYGLQDLPILPKNFS